MIVRPSLESDVPAIAAIYAHHVLNGTGTFEETPPTVEEMSARRAAVLGHGLPYLVAEDDGRILAFAYAGPFRTRPAYRYTVENSVYVAHDALGRGVGKAIMLQVLDGCEAAGVRQMMAVIGDSANAGSLALHASLGFMHVGVAPSLGFKQGRWLDVIWMQRALNGGDSTLPQGAGLALG